VTVTRPSWAENVTGIELPTVVAVKLRFEIETATVTGAATWIGIEIVTEAVTETEILTVESVAGMEPATAAVVKLSVESETPTVTGAETWIEIETVTVIETETETLTMAVTAIATETVTVMLLRNAVTVPLTAPSTRAVTATGA